MKHKFKVYLGGYQQFVYTVMGETMEDVYSEIFKKVFVPYCPKRVKVSRASKGTPTGSKHLHITGYPHPILFHPA